MNLHRSRIAVAAGAATICLAGLGASAAASTAPVDTKAATDSSATSGQDAMALLAASAANVQDAPVRFDMYIELVGAPFDFGDAPFVTGSAAGDDLEMTIDMNPLFESISDDLPSEFANADLSLSMLVVGSDAFVRGGMLDLIAELDPRFTQFGEIGDGWGSLDPGRVPEIADLLEELAGAGASPADTLQLLNVATSAEIIGTETGPDGGELTGVRVLIPASELDQISADDNVLADVPDLEVPYDVWIDADGYPVRMDINLTNEMLQAAADASGDADLDALGAFDVEMNLRMEFSDYNDPSITFAAPTDTVDVSDDFVTMTESS